MHFGSLIAATASYLDTRVNQGSWLLRIEDVDTPRIRDGAIQSIILTLEAHGFEWDEAILYQSQRFTAYQSALDELITNRNAYPCSCSRKFFKPLATVGQSGLIYPGLCREQLASPDSPLCSFRLLTNNDTINFCDAIQGVQQQRLESEIGDFILKRNDGVYAYQLAVVVDDDFQGITHVVRGYDLIDNTIRQLYLQQLLDYTSPSYLHFPIAVDDSGNKLSKQNHSPEVQNQHALSNIYHTLAFLGQKPPAKDNFDNITDLWKWAIMHWNPSNIPKKSLIKPI